MVSLLEVKNLNLQAVFKAFNAIPAFGGAVGSLQFDQQQIYGGIKHSSQQRARHTSIRKLTSTALLLPQVNMSLKARQDLAML